MAKSRQDLRTAFDAAGQLYQGATEDLKDDVRFALMEFQKRTGLVATMSANPVQHIVRDAQAHRDHVITAYRVGITLHIGVKA